ncbi:MAG: DNA polymerase III subunit delta' [Desulfobulbaceae bacterium]|nr:DNA polymerase III subunit delta' [Desulfobulbaceae bacterium]
MFLSEIQGQAKAVKLLGRALENGRLAHAYLFIGPDGVGKVTAAKAMTAVLFCRQGEIAAPCGSCPGCMQYASGNHPDFLHIVPQGAVIKIDQVRELKKALAFSPLESDYRIILLEDVHTMRREAANSLLKLLEEPPAGNILLLTADESEPLLPTITSRCQVIPFYPLSHELTTAVIRRLNPELTIDQASFIATLTDGCPGLAGSFETDELLQLRAKIIAMLLDGNEDEAASTATALLLAAETAAIKNGFELLLNLLRFFFRETMVSMGGKSSGNSGCRELDLEIERARERWNLAELSDMVNAVDYAEMALARNCSQGLVCEVLFIKLLHVKSPAQGDPYRTMELTDR